MTPAERKHLAGACSGWARLADYLDSTQPDPATATARDWLDFL